ncbi:SH3 domain-containing protein [Lysinibacillus sp. Ag94]|uniref:SH3 domain-containing protein n=1 Tax=Lysinibacillus sp. Ag94 TaxID=2936682 RepID=UPI002010A4AF|nr:SH3 domain-containing protein [Lysinibacillus sp. Ag94]UPW84368.1 SH3 domain-containing protein [Lysinibacillus sp. Ag94]
MKKILKPLISVIAIGTLSLSINIDKNVLANNIANTCGYDSASNVNPDYSTMNCLLTETALSYDVPPEIVKAIAEGESGNWRHFDSNGKAIVTADNGIGIMQITNQAGYDQDRLKSDIVYNIQAGVKTLDDMFKRKDLPSINGGERDVLEHWYFAIMAYNGTKPVNSPIVQATDERNANAYQERILRIIEKLELIDLTELPFKREHFQYDSNSRENIKFSAMNYKFDVPLTKSKYFFKTNQKVSATTTNVTLRTRPTKDSTAMGTLREGEIVTITGPFEYEEVSTKKNHFVWYPVKRNDGTKGYVASSYLNYSASTPTPTPPVTPPTTGNVDVSKFADYNANQYWAEDFKWAVNIGIISGYLNVKNPSTGKYENLLKPYTNLTENQMLTILFRYFKPSELASTKANTTWYGDKNYQLATKYSLPVLGANTASKQAIAGKDITRGNFARILASMHYGKTLSQSEAIKFLRDNGLTTTKTNEEFKPNDSLTRAHAVAFFHRYEQIFNN